MKRRFSTLFMCLLLVFVTFTAASCGKVEEAIRCGVTQYAPMNYLDDDGNWTGFDTEFARLVGEKLGRKVIFVEIQWSNKFLELESGTISAIWNGMTANADESDGTPRSELCIFSYSYMQNKQCVVIRSENIDDYQKPEDLIGKIIAVEEGSAGAAQTAAVVGDKSAIVNASTQTATFAEVMSGAAECAVIDVFLAERMAGSGDFADLMIAPIELEYEVFAVGFKKTNTDLRDKVNQAIRELHAEGKLQPIADKYGINDFYIDFDFK